MSSVPWGIGKRVDDMLSQPSTHQPGTAGAATQGKGGGLPVCELMAAQIEHVWRSGARQSDVRKPIAVDVADRESIRGAIGITEHHLSELPAGSIVEEDRVWTRRVSEDDVRNRVAV